MSKMRIIVDSLKMGTVSGHFPVVCCTVIIDPFRDITFPGVGLNGVSSLFFIGCFTSTLSPGFKPEVLAFLCLSAYRLFFCFISVSRFLVLPSFKGTEN